MPDEIDRAIEREGPESVAAVFLEPVQNSGGCFPPPPGYFARVREICDKHGVLLVSETPGFYELKRARVSGPVTTS